MTGVDLAEEGSEKSVRTLVALKPGGGVKVLSMTFERPDGALEVFDERPGGQRDEAHAGQDN